MQCRCGCGAELPENRSYVLGHNARVANPWSGRDWKHNLGKPMLALETNPAWKGESASFEAKHARIYRRFGKADRCDLDPTHVTTTYHWANKDHQYRPVREDWMRLCSKCHKRFDGETGSVRSDEFKQKVSLGLQRAYAEGRR